MCSVAKTPPLGHPSPIDPTFKVPVCLQEPLWMGPLDVNDVGLEIASLCSQLDLLCHHELAKKPSNKIEHSNFTSDFEGTALLLLSRINNLVTNIYGPGTQIKDYLQHTGLAKLFPRATTYVANPDDMSLSLKKTCFDGYICQVAAMHQVVSLSQQISHDVCHLDNHKYIAHQLAVLYQSLNNLDEIPGIEELKKNLEDNFGVIKENLTTSGEDEPRLPFEYAHWLSEVTETIMQLVSQFPKDITRAFSLPAKSLVKMKK